jgi:hypothetical protein
MRFSQGQELATRFIGTIDLAALNLLQGAIDLFIERAPLIFRPAFFGIQRF